VIKILHDFITSQLGPRVGYFLGSKLPRSWAYALADFLARVLASRKKSQLYRSIRGNQAVIRDLPYDSSDLDDAVFRVLQNAGRGYVDWFQAMVDDEDFETKYCSIDEHMITQAKQASQDGHGVIFVGAHMSSFNLFMVMMARRGLPMQVLSYHDVRGSYIAENDLRRRIGIEITPISNESLRKAIRRLKAGGFVVTGVDRSDLGGIPMNFFGRKVVLPIGHARMAIRTNAYLVLGVVQKNGEGKYHVTGPDIIIPERSGDESQDTLRLAQRTIEILEGYIRDRPEEWMMFLPIWPEVIPAPAGSKIR
jgi:KDO2-lipid IV(A) lauroyltransferase